MKELFRPALSVFLASVLFAGCSKPDEPNTASRSEPRATAESSNYFKTHFQDESQYIVETVLSDIAEMAFYAKDQKLPAASGFFVEAMEKPDSVSGAPVYACQITWTKNQASVKFDLSVNSANSAIWSPEVYTTATRAIFDSLNIQAGKASEQNDDLSVLDDLTDGKAKTIEELSQDLSVALQKNFRDPLLHEKAALVLGAFVLRETSGKFYNVRAPLCRMTAHLAFANALGGQPSLSGRFAEILLDTGMGRQKEALAKMAKVDTNEKAAVIWKRVLHAINTGDYRPLAEIANATPLERAAWFGPFPPAAASPRPGKDCTSTT